MATLEIVRKHAKKKNAIPPEKIATPRGIEKIIKDIIGKRKPLDVSIVNKTKYFSSSCIIKIGKFKGAPCIAIDTLMPKLEGVRALEGTPMLEIGFRYNKVPYTFKSRFLGLSMDRFPIVTISYPLVIFIHQFRSSFRISPSLNQSIDVNIKYSGQGRIGFGIPKPGMGSGLGQESYGTGNLVEDISMGGMAFLTKDLNIRVGTEILVNFTLPEVGNFSAKAEVKSLIPKNTPKFPFKCGVCFRNVSGSNKEKIYKYLLKLQRQELKRIKGKDNYSGQG